MNTFTIVRIILLALAIWAVNPETVLAACPCDCDGDGHDALVGCGGDDCDDGDPNRYPGNVEVCDASDHDEDCDSSTFGERDTDHDGYFDDKCCNDDNCGNDCDDTRAFVNPGAPETCDSIDNDCDGAVDWATGYGNLRVLAYQDNDRDGWGNSGLPGIELCPDELLEVSRSGVAGDCNDKVASIHPGAMEACNGLDDNCDGVQDEGLSGFCD